MVVMLSVSLMNSFTTHLEPAWQFHLGLVWCSWLEGGSSLSLGILSDPKCIYVYIYIYTVVVYIYIYIHIYIYWCGAIDP